jgi:hypothetical protein
MRIRFSMVVSVLALATPLAFGGELGEVAGFQAESVTYREGEEPGSRLQVYVAPQGQRLEGIPPRGITLIEPADQATRWMVDADAQVYAVDKSAAKGAELGGLLAHKPCKGFPESENLGTETLQGRAVQKWKCQHPEFGTVTQWFAPDLGTVVRDRTPKGEIQELRNIRVGKQPAKLFRFPEKKGFEKVPVIQLFR